MTNNHATIVTFFLFLFFSNIHLQSRFWFDSLIFNNFNPSNRNYCTLLSTYIVIVNLFNNCKMNIFINVYYITYTYLLISSLKDSSLQCVYTIFIKYIYMTYSIFGSQKVSERASCTCLLTIYLHLPSLHVATFTQYVQ